MGQFGGVGPGGFNLGNIIDQSGLSSNYTGGVTDFDTFVASNPTHDSSRSVNDWFSVDGTTTGNVDFDLGGTFKITSMAFWGNGGEAGRVTSFTLLADTNSLFTSAITLGNFTRGGSGAASSSPIETFTFTETYASHVRMQITGVAGASFAAVGEVAFEGTAVPEPSSLALLGVVAAFAVLRRRKRARGIEA